MGLIGSVYPEPEDTEYQIIKENNSCYTERQVMEDLRIRKKRINVIIPLLQHDPVTSGSLMLQMKYVPAVCILFHCLHNLVAGGILLKQTLIVAGNDASLVCHNDGTVLPGTIAI